MRHHPENADILEAACASLCDLGREAALPQEALDTAIKTVCKAMARFPEHAALQRLSLIFMRNAFNSDENDEQGDNSRSATIAARAGCIPAVLRAMRTHPADSEIQSVGCCVVYWFAALEESRFVDELWEEQALVTMLDALSACLEACPVSGPANSLSNETQEFTYATIINMFRSAADASRTRTKQALQGLKVIPRSMARHSHDDYLLGKALEAIGILVCENQEHACILGKDGIKAAIDAMRAHESNVELQFGGCLALNCMVVGDQERIRYADEIGCIEWVHRVVRVYPKHAHLHMIASVFMKEMIDHAGDEPRRVKMAETGVVRTLTATLRMHKSNLEVSRHAGPWSTSHVYKARNTCNS
jgi:hypothetical protein